MPEVDNVTTLELIKKRIAEKISLFTAGRTDDEFVLNIAKDIDLTSFIYSEKNNTVFYLPKIEDLTVREDVKKSFYTSGAFNNLLEVDVRSCLEEQGIQLIPFDDFKTIRKNIDSAFRAIRREDRENKLEEIKRREEQAQMEMSEVAPVEESVRTSTEE